MDGPTPAKTPRNIKLLFAAIFLCSIFVNVDSGAIASSLDAITDRFQLSSIEQGLLGSMLYAGMTFSCFFAGTILQRVKPKTVMCTALFFDAVFIACFASATNKYVALLSRLGEGLALAFITIYSPVWVDEFAPEARRTIWMSCVQAATPFGIVLGYILAGLLSTDFKWTFVAQVGAMAPFVIASWFVPAKLFAREATGAEFLAKIQEEALPPNKRQSLTLHPPERESVLKLLKTILSSPIYVCTVWALASLYFVVSGIQFWITKYLTSSLGFPKVQVVTAFSLTSATSPVLGVFAGGMLIDKIGGYKGWKGLNRAAAACSVMAILAVACAVSTMFISTSLPAIISLLWGLLFFGGGIMPGATGILISSVPPHMRSFGSSVSTLFYNGLGYSCGPFIPGAVAQSTGSLDWGYRLIMLWSIFGLVGISGSWFFARRAHRKYHAEAEDTEEQRAPLLGDDSPVEYASTDDTNLSLSGRLAKTHGVNDGDEEPFATKKGAGSRPGSRPSSRPTSGHFPPVNIFPDDIHDDVFYELTHGGRLPFSHPFARTLMPMPALDPPPAPVVDAHFESQPARDIEENSSLL